MTETIKQPFPQAVQQQLSLLNLRLNDMMQELNATVKLLIETNTSLQQENADLKAKLEKNNKS